MVGNDSIIVHFRAHRAVRLDSQMQEELLLARKLCAMLSRTFFQIVDRVSTGR